MAQSSFSDPVHSIETGQYLGNNGNDKRPYRVAKEPPGSCKWELYRAIGNWNFYSPPINKL